MDTITRRTTVPLQASESAIRSWNPGLSREENDPRLRPHFGLPTSPSRNDRLSRLQMIVAGYHVFISKRLPDWTVDMSTDSDRVRR